MTTSEIFSMANFIAIPMWLLLVFVPKWKITRFLIDYKLIPIALSLVYAVYIIHYLRTEGMMDFGSLNSVMGLFTKENAVLAGWIHYLVFDLLVGIWIVNQNNKYNIHQLLIALCLFGTFMFGPIGFLLFMIMKSLKNSENEIS
ncbi:hypothetical protein BTO06_07370 [Tenacibaculum sp. SZ-18]|uniref:ABA4-like family protein n=1 Tax=Tenacibaculum sp. SZ-18 TaxID=754423 RepID=UPI000C2CE6C3|nr:ABA4-like family protein [Tenacibaculum sp. SZ-18]AUC14966.1 hypothetical protein BTO06_07370 [Tenacibaculum sp. SZ-18]